MPVHRNSRRLPRSAPRFSRPPRRPERAGLRLMPSADTPATRLATRIAFFRNGFSIAAWAPLVPFVKSRLGVSNGPLGLLLLWIGVGSIASMLLTGPLCSRFGSKPLVGVTGFALAVILPALAL